MPRIKAGTKYAPLRQWLLAQPPGTSQVELTFAQIERIIDAGLPKSAYTYPAWWANETKPTHFHARAWLEIGWRVDHLDLLAERVMLRRRDLQG
jgi:hypothetical protein